MASEGQIKKVIIVGAGPSGLLLALLLNQSHIPVTIIEASQIPDPNPRAAHYAPSAVHDFTRAKVIDQINAQGFHPDAVSWRYPNGEVIATLPIAKGVSGGPMVVLPLDRLIKLLVGIAEERGVEVLWG